MAWIKTRTTARSFTATWCPIPLHPLIARTRSEKRSM